ARLADDSVLLAYLRVLVKLGQSFIQPEGKRLCGAEEQVRVLVIHGRVRVRAASIEAQENVALVGGAQKQTGQLQLAFCQVFFGLDSPEALPIFQSKDDDGHTIFGQLWKCGVEDQPHALQLFRGLACVLFAGITVDGEMRTGDLQPAVLLLARRSCNGNKNYEIGGDPKTAMPDGCHAQTPTSLW